MARLGPRIAADRCRFWADRDFCAQLITDDSILYSDCTVLYCLHRHDSGWWTDATKYLNRGARNNGADMTVNWNEK
ncbi:MAG: hypothetical protein C4K47_03385 [Candidatus Thorarchaeota archaeon]|nr:MAG: hypothetical protein C4K47_03385 [Candidatus Thorarchaeota archaeon]